MVAEYYAVFWLLVLDFALVVGGFGDELFVVGGFEVGVGLLFKIMIVGSHSIFTLLAID
jgi:hypothetical protein